MKARERERERVIAVCVVMASTRLEEKGVKEKFSSSILCAILVGGFMEVAMNC